MNNQENEKTVVDFGDEELVFLIISSEGKIYNIAPKLSIGRNSSNDIVISSQKISRNHAIIEVLNSRLILKDLDSSNGSYVNGEKIKSSVELSHGDSIKFDKQEYIVEITKPREYESTETIIDPEYKPDEKSNSGIEDIKQQETPSKPVPKIDEMPASWVEETAVVGGTRMMNVEQLRALRSKNDQILVASSNVTALHSFIKGQEEQVFELPVLDTNKVSGWEIGRNADSDIIINHPSVSGKHAQIIHQNGRWKIVNLVSTNGILINGEKKLSSFLSDGDKIIIGSTTLVFKTPVNKSNPSLEYHTTGSSNLAKVITPIILLVLTAIIIYLIYYLVDNF